MADLSASITKARKAGYSDAEIAAHIAKDPAMGSKVTSARKAGYSDAEIIAHLGKPSTTMDVVKSFGSGLLKAGAGLVDTIAQASPLGVMSGNLATAANVAETVSKVAQGNRSVTTPAAPFSVASTETNRRAYKPQTTAGEYSQTLGQNVPNAFVPASWGRRAVNVFAPALASEAAGQTARSMGYGPTGEAVARGGGALFGAGAASLRPGNLFRQDAPEIVIGQRSRQDPVAMQARAQAFRDNNVEPTLVDVLDDSGRGLVRAAANRQTPGRQAANDFAEQRVISLPERLGEQARANMSRDRRTPDQIRAAQVARRTTNANQAFGAVRGDVIELGDNAMTTFRVPDVIDAVTAAAKRERDPATRGALFRLAQWAESGQAPTNAPPITVGMADRISRVLLGKAGVARGANDTDLAATLTDFGNLIRNPARAASPGYGDALEGFAADSRLTEAAGVGENLLVRNTDEFVDAAGSLGARERVLAAAAGRRAIERASGENPSSAISVARKIAIAPEQQQRTAALIGPARAGRLQAGMAAEARAVRNATQIAPGAGSTTFLNADDGAALSEAAGVVSDVANRNLPGIIRWGYDAFRRRGLNDQQVERLINMATDPNQTDAAIAAIARSLDPQTRQVVFRIRDAAGLGAIGMATGGSQATSAERP